MPKFIYSIAVEVIADDQDEATYLIYSTPLKELKTDCFEIEIEENE
jgi:hypothetical protein